MGHQNKDPEARPYIRIHSVSKTFGAVTAVDHVSLDIYKGELFCLLGGSGCGKSTLLRMLAGFEHPTSGRILIDDVDLAGTPPHQRPVNMMFQSYALFPHMSVWGNIAFGLKQERLPSSEIDARVADILNLVKLGEFAKRKPHQLSGGQRQRVALARAMVKQPKVLLLDEPLGALDKKLREETQFELMKLQDETGITFVVVTHDQEEAMTLATRIGVMNEGEIVQVGTPAEIYEFPSSRFVADFIGSVNIFEGRLTEDEADHVRIASEEAGCTLFVNHGISASPGAKVWVALRPEKISIRKSPINTEGVNGHENAASGVVEEIAYLGDLSVYRIILDTGKRIQVTMPNLERTATHPVTWDEEVFLSWGPSSGIVLTQ